VVGRSQKNVLWSFGSQFGKKLREAAPSPGASPGCATAITPINKNTCIAEPLELRGVP